MDNNKQLAEKKATMSPSTWFMNEIMNSLGAGHPDFTVTNAQKAKIQGYFSAMTHVLNEQGLKWSQVAVDYKLAQDLMVCAQIGFDMRSEKMLYAVPRMDNKVGKYRFTLQKGYMGRVYEAMKYAEGNLEDITAMLVYSTDKFVPHIHDSQHPGDTYEFEIMNPFDRGSLMGGFAYLIYDNPARNRLVLVSKADIEKRRAVSKSSKFWGGWYDEMALKTVYIAGAKAVKLDPDKLDEAYERSQVMESDGDDLEVQNQIHEKQAQAELVELEPEDLQALPEAAPRMEATIPVPEEPEAVPVEPKADHKAEEKAAEMPEKAF
jgi:recombination protein RecT